MITYKKFIAFLMPWLALALIMNLLRLAMTDVHSYVYMNWNIFLAFLPLGFMYLFEKTKHMYVKGLYFFAWLFFLPNAVYVVTDLIHLRNVGPEWMLWYDGMMIFAYALIGILINGYVLLKMKENIFPEKHTHQNIFLVVISIVSSFGVYLGRYIRFNTWDIVARPIDLTGDIFHILGTEYGNPVFIMTIIFFTLLSLVGVSSLSVLLKKEL